MHLKSTRELCQSVGEGITKVKDEGEIVAYWLEHQCDGYYASPKEHPIRDLDDARLACRHIDDGRIGLNNDPEHHPVWYESVYEKPKRRKKNGATT